MKSKDSHDLHWPIGHGVSWQCWKMATSHLRLARGIPIALWRGAGFESGNGDYPTTMGLWWEYTVILSGSKLDSHLPSGPDHTEVNLLISVSHSGPIPIWQGSLLPRNHLQWTLLRREKSKSRCTCVVVDLCINWIEIIQFDHLGIETKRNNCSWNLSVLDISKVVVLPKNTGAVI